VAAIINIYVASTVVPDAFANRRRRGANLMRVPCLREEGDHLSMRLTAHQTHELNRCRKHSAVFRRQEGHIGVARHGYHGYKNLV